MPSESYREQQKRETLCSRGFGYVIVQVPADPQPFSDEPPSLEDAVDFDASVRTGYARASVQAKDGDIMATYTVDGKRKWVELSKVRLNKPSGMKPIDTLV
jgi:hypothetical protein